MNSLVQGSVRSYLLSTALAPCPCSLPPLTSSCVYLPMHEDYAASVNHLVHDPMRVYRAKRDQAHRSVSTKYHILGFISSGTYGRVYKAQSRDDERLHAIKKFKPDKEGDTTTYTGISQSAIREIAVRAVFS